MSLSNIKRLIVHCGMLSLFSVCLITWLRVRPLGLIFLLIFFFWLYKTKFGVEILPPEELIIKLNAVLSRMKSMRETNATLFCAITSAALTSVAILGHLVSGSSVVLIFLIILLLISTKYDFKILKLQRTSFNWSERCQENEIDDFLPEVNEINMCVLERASDQSNISLPEEAEEKSEEIPCELLIPNCIPEIDENSTDEDDALSIGVPEEMHDRPSALSEIEFKKSHFKKDSSVSTSSSDDESLSKGLKFPDHSNVDSGTQIRSNPQAQSMIITSNILPGLVSGIVSWASMSNDNRISSSRRQIQPSRVTLSDDESEFEFVNTEEYQ